MDRHDTALENARIIIERAVRGDAPSPVVESFYDPATSSISHVLHDPTDRAAIIVDPILDYDASSGRTSVSSVDAIAKYVGAHDLRVAWSLDTHVHADHMSGSATLRRRFGASVGMSRHVLTVCDHFADIFDVQESTDRAQRAFDQLFEDGDMFTLGGVECIALHVPGHTPADMAYVIGNAVLTGDTVFMPDFGTARADFPGGDAAQLYRSARRLLSLPTQARLLHCHDYPPPTRGRPEWTSTVADQRAYNIHVRDGVAEAEFVAMRSARDACLAPPALMLPSVQVNLRAGELPTPAANGRRYLKLPLDAL